VLLSIAELVDYRRSHRPAPRIQQVGCASVPTPYGDFRAVAFSSALDNAEHLALVHGDLGDGQSVLVRLHSECLTGDVFHSRRCDCGSQLERAMQLIAREGSGVVVYVRGHEGRGIGLGPKLEAYALQDTGLDTLEANWTLGFPADARDYGVAAQILASLGVRQVRLLTNNPAKCRGLERRGLRVSECVPLVGELTPENRRYLETKRDRLGHYLSTLVGLSSTVARDRARPSRSTLSHRHNVTL
jgi:3,4-dihydroxy 2-butanone 4-phosphate synthase/GTP cyclohydrolase II